jgi:hypothetical protein
LNSVTSLVTRCFNAATYSLQLSWCALQEINNAKRKGACTSRMAAVATMIVPLADSEQLLVRLQALPV